METIALMGPYDDAIKKVLREQAPDCFDFVDVPDKTAFHLLRHVHYIILRVLGTSGELIRSLPDLRLIQRWGVGFDKVDIHAAGEGNIPVAVTPGMNAASVSEMAVLHMLAVYRKLLMLHNNVINGQWQKPGLASCSYTICGKTVGLVGLGNIGRMVAKKVQAFGAEVQYYDLFRLSSVEELKLGIRYLELKELMRSSDIISLHVPLTDATHNMINREALSLMKPEAILVNTARGGLVQEDALAEALRMHKILGAGLDCQESEPPTSNQPLLQLDNVVLTPHMGGSTMDTSLNMARHCIENIVRISRGEELPLRDVVNREYLPKRKTQTL